MGIQQAGSPMKPLSLGPAKFHSPMGSAGVCKRQEENPQPEEAVSSCQDELIASHTSGQTAQVSLAEKPRKAPRIPSRVTCVQMVLVPTRLHQRWQLKAHF